MTNKLPLSSLAGVLTWALVFIITLSLLPPTTEMQHWLGVISLFLLYGAAFIALTFDYFRCPPHSPAGKSLLVLQLVAALALLVLLPQSHFEYLAILTIIWAAVLPFALSQRNAIALTLVVVILWFSIASYQKHHSLWITALLYGAFHLFAVLVQSTAKSEQTAKEELAAKHQQLQATQQLLQAASRQSERTRIARNLHDLVGHHLTALTIQLQVAGHITEGEAKLQVDKCHQLAKLLLADVREAVSTMRQYADVSLLDAIQPLVALLPEQLKVRLQIPADIMLNDLQQAQHLLCIVQEAISNCLKHSGATELQITAAVTDGELQLSMVDNGKLAANWRPGNGIKGMQERLAECGGVLQVDSTQQAMHLSLRLPYMESDNA
ncbi:sensor histidine kinase [Rheinheimera sp. YQF-2]|uniref:Sensor histidine kinase n=1 Tax=Rheinheimera lutimaris TaxID=2740584 RepID=A0A7Y5AQS2_9GAMM|nr:histidine kinase [Rheinheimera lutimaris]NRQ42803.1 sensor histidine kinase [Rheinheimera lutimaris]